MGRARTPLGTHGKIFISKTAAGTWCAITYYRDMSGRRRKLQRTHRTKAGAEHALREYATQITQTAGKTLTPHSTLEKAAELWWEEWKSEKPRPHNTIVAYKYSMEKTITPVIGQLQLIECTTGVLSLFIKQLAADRSVSTAIRARMILKMIFETAERYDAIARNPVDSIKNPSAPKKEIKILSIDEIERMRTILTGRNALAFELMLATGGRIGEILAIRWEDIEQTPAGVIAHLSGTLTGVGKYTKRQEHRKSGKNISLYLPEFAVRALEKYASETCKDHRHGPIFIGSPRANGLLSPDTFRTCWNSKLKGTEFEHVHPHMIRATVATMLANNADAAAASAQLGNTEAVLRAHYWMQDDLAPDARAILEVFGG